jgi:hypothetical protein
MKKFIAASFLGVSLVLSASAQKDLLGPPGNPEDMFTAKPDAPQLKIPRGIQYEVLSSREIVKPSMGWCGCNDLSLPNNAVFREETRRYTEYGENGRELRHWTKVTNIFVRCLTL